MEKNNEPNLNSWVNDRLRRAKLDPDIEWQPDVHRAFARLQGHRETESGRRRKWGWTVASATTISLLLMAFPVTRTLAGRWASACVSLLGHLSSSEPSLTYTKLGDRKLVPDFALNDAAGKQIRLSDFRGKVVLLNFWTTECVACQVEIPWFMEFQRTYQDRDLVVLGVSLDDDGWKSVKPYLDEKNINYPVMVGGNEIAHLYGASKSVPLALIVDRSGRIAVIHFGLCPKGEYETAIKALLNEQ
jgi:peroxiredoxin